MSINELKACSREVLQTLQRKRLTSWKRPTVQNSNIKGCGGLR